MKILYGVQATGNGHITRARALAPKLRALGVEVDYLFSGRKPEQFFDMQVFGDYQVRQGLSFVTSKGSIQYGQTLLQANFWQLSKDIRAQELQDYDLIISDFEPITAWAGRLAKKKVIGIGHQYAFAHAIPKASNSLVAQAVLKYMAPATLGVGLHWHHFDQPILPPIIEPSQVHSGQADRVLVYLPFESTQQVLSLLQGQSQCQFHLFCGDLNPGQYLNVQVHGFSRQGFADQLHAAEAVLCNAGFELVSEALALGRKILVKPVQGQMEQESNALALEVLGLGASMSTLSSDHLSAWLAQGQPHQVQYPDVADMLAHWLAAGAQAELSQLVQQAWQSVSLPKAAMAAGPWSVKIA